MASDRPRRSGTRRGSRTDEVQQRVKQLILERNLVPGAPMPTEIVLVEELDVSRNSLREALKALQAVGIVEIRHGFGMYVGRMSLTAMVDELTFYGQIAQEAGRNQLANLVEIRHVLERGLMEEVIDRDLGELSQELDAAIAQMEQEAADGYVTPETDRRFHELLYEPLNNPMVNQLLSAFWEVYRALQHDLDPTESTPQQVVEKHRAIYDTLRSRDRAGVADAMRLHFEDIRERLARGSKPHGLAG